MIEAAESAIVWLHVHRDGLPWVLAFLALVAIGWGVRDSRRRKATRGDQAEEACAIADLPPMPAEQPRPVMTEWADDPRVMFYGQGPKSMAAADAMNRLRPVVKQTADGGLIVMAYREHDGPGGVVTSEGRL